MVLLAGCGGGGGGGGTTTAISGTAATGAALAGTVDLIDANGVARSASISANGAFSLDTTGLSAPIVLRVTSSGGGILYSWADAVTGVFNITPLTTLALELMRANLPGGPADLAALFADWTSVAGPTQLSSLQAALLEAQAIINANLSSQLQAMGLTATTYDFLRTAFTPNGSGIDGVLDLIHLSFGNGSFSLTDAGGTPLTFDITIDISGYNIGGGGGGGGGTLTCDTSLFQANSVHQATAQELASFAGNYTGEIYSPDNTGNYVASNGTASFSSAGVLTLNGQAKTATSICVDNAAGPYGVVLYVHFADGHVDLFGNQTFSGAIDTPSGGGTGSLTLTVTISGVAAANVNIDGVTKPASQADFCADMTSDSTTSLNHALGAVGTFTIDSCTFDGSVGNVSATLAVTSPVSMNVPYTVVYTYN
ncbi:MAG: hypothetical protein HGA75_06275 [Thiobacillus sp.]|nr:hypothetical protein [Thiobacillus sp.]